MTHSLCSDNVSVANKTQFSHHDESFTGSSELATWLNTSRQRSHLFQFSYIFGEQYSSWTSAWFCLQEIWSQNNNKTILPIFRQKCITKFVYRHMDILKGPQKRFIYARTGRKNQISGYCWPNTSILHDFCNYNKTFTQHESGKLRKLNYSKLYTLASLLPFLPFKIRALDASKQYASAYQLKLIFTKTISLKIA